LSPVIGAEIGDVDLTGALDPPVVSEIKRALTEYSVVFFRDQPLTIEQHVRFARLFGELFIHPASKALEGHPALIPIKADATSSQVAGEIWHTDTSCERAPPMGSILHLHVVPPVGGDTLFASMYAAYEGLSSTMRAMLVGLTAHHSGDKAFRGYYGDARQYPNADHPVICRHPVSGRPLLFVNRFYTTRINGLPGEESDQLLRFLFQHIETPEFQCRFRWHPNSIAFWDNCCTQHRALFDYFPAERRGYRIQIQGQAPAMA
jgi:taurine dioxygenase